MAPRQQALGTEVRLSVHSLSNPRFDRRDPVPPLRVGHVVVAVAEDAHDFRGQGLVKNADHRLPDHLALEGHRAFHNLLTRPPPNLFDIA